MPHIRVTTRIAAPVEVCFDFARSIDLHVKSQAASGERAVAGRTSGLIEFGETVTWEARHLGVRQRFTSQITAFDPPRHFRDEMLKGAFASFVHDHLFFEDDDGTEMVDALDFRSPLGPLGWLVNRLYLTRYLERLLTERGLAIKSAAEAAS
jgi:ligand-binding SRPBCC domain-containing protein